jgi:hypothetical protein
VKKQRASSSENDTSSALRVMASASAVGEVNRVAVPGPMEVLRVPLASADGFPNNAKLPLLIYKVGVQPWFVAHLQGFFCSHASLLCWCRQCRGLVGHEQACLCCMIVVVTLQNTATRLAANTTCSIDP